MVDSAAHKIINYFFVMFFFCIPIKTIKHKLYEQIFFIPLFFEGGKNRERESNGDNNKKMPGYPFHLFLDYGKSAKSILKIPKV